MKAGDTLGAYRVLDKLGEGGMGEVYRARDTKLNRDVAIKVLPEIFALDPDRLTRFTREAQTLAALNHPNIASIYGIEESGNVRALVMELADGEDLSAIIARGPMPLTDALPIAKQIAEALEAAHELGIVHRDLKPANIKVRADGTVKVLDFGLAKAMDPAGGSSANIANSPTLTAHATALGIIIGTAAYMAPEQARGKSVDKRADVWAFGVVLYEMLTGRQAFTGDTITDVIAAVVTRDPDWTTVPASTPPAISQLLVHCLEKDPKHRLRDVGDARFALESSLPQSGRSALITAPLPSASVATRARPWGWIAATAVCAAIAVFLAATSWRGGRPSSGGDNFELAIAPPPETEFQIGSNRGNVIVSPDGTKIAFVAATSKATTLWVRSLAVDDARPLSGTDGASNQFWSPDGKRLGFFANGKLRTVDIAGGLPEAIADAPAGRGGSWTEDGSILFTPTGGATVFKIAATGGDVKPVTKLDATRGEDAHYWPVVLPGGSRFLYFARSARVENSGIYLARIDGSAPPVRVVASLSSGVLANRPSTGEPYLLWVRDGDLLAQPFDIDAGVLRGDATTIAKGVRVEESQRQAFASASRTGIVAWATANAADGVFALYSRDGRRVRTLDIAPGEIVEPALSPDGRRLLYMRVEKGQGSIYLHDLESGATQRVSTTAGFSDQASWTPDGRAVIYEGNVEGTRVLYRLTLDSAAEPQLIVRGSFSGGFETADGRFVIFTASDPKTGLDVMAAPVSSSGTPVPLAATPASEVVTSVSSDDRWITIGDLAGRSNAVRRLMTKGGNPTLGGMFSLGSDGIGPAILRRDGGEVFVATADGSLKSATLTPVGEGLTLGPLRTLFKLPAGDGSFSPSPHGNEFVVQESPFAKGQTLRVLTNWEKRLSK